MHAGVSRSDSEVERRPNEAPCDRSRGEPRKNDTFGGSAR